MSSFIQFISNRLSTIAERWVPDPFVIAVLLTFLTMLLGLTVGDDLTRGEPSRVIELWTGGVWRFLSFSMEMCLVLVTGHALATAPLMKQLVASITQRANHASSAIALTTLVAMSTGLINWGLGLIVGALTAREMGLSCARRGINVHYPLLGAAGYTGLLVWHGGLSGTAPLKVTQVKNLAELNLDRDVIPLTETIFSSLNLTIIIGVIVLTPLLLWMMSPPSEQCASIDQWITPSSQSHTSVTDQSFPQSTPARHFEESRWLTLLLAALVLIAWSSRVIELGVSRIDLSVINLGALGFGLLLHPSLRSYGEAATEAAGTCAGVMLQFPLYAGIMSVMSGSGLTAMLAEQVSALASRETLAPFTFLMAGFVNLFVPSGGGQWGVQGPLVLQSASALNSEAGAAVIAFAHGDAWTNMLQPFWALPLLAVTQLKARDIVGYSATLMLVLTPWYLLIFWLF